MHLRRLILSLLLTGLLFAEEKNPAQVNPYAPPLASLSDEEPPLPSYKRAFGYGAALGVVALWAIVGSSTNSYNESIFEYAPRIPRALWTDGEYRLRFGGLHLSAMIFFGGFGLTVRGFAGELRDYFSRPKAPKGPTLFDDLSPQPFAVLPPCERSLENLTYNRKPQTPR